MFNRLLHLRPAPTSLAAQALHLTTTSSASFAPSTASQADDTQIIRSPELSPRQNLIFLLQTAAEIEHTLLVEYLYAAYSLRPNAVPTGAPAGVTTNAWRIEIVKIAVEEMGHLLTVQNALRFAGGPLHFDREHLPYRSQLYPFPFTLQRLTKKSLAKYVFAEMPTEIPDGIIPPDTRAEIAMFAREDAGGVGLNHVGALYQTLIKAFAQFKDTDFPTGSAPWQAAAGDFRADDSLDRPLVGVKVYPITSVDSAVKALQAVATQGEGIQPEGMATPGDIAAAHFKRFYDIYKNLPNDFDPSLPVPSNPNTTDVPLVPPPDLDGQQSELKLRPGRITNVVTKLWANLFNVRYRMLLAELEHRLSVPDQPDAQNQRDKLVEWIFADMKDRKGSLKGLAAVIVGLDRTDLVTDGKAGPTFELPFSLELPDRARERWEMHRDLNKAVLEIVGKLRPNADATQKPILDDVEKDAKQRLTDIDMFAGGPF
jgi:hypothetical protein